MIDLLCLSEFTWIVVWLGTRSQQRVLLYTAGIFTAGLASNQLSGWLTRTLTPPTSPVFRWFESHLTTNTKSVMLHSFIPPETAAFTGLGNHTQWIAYSVLRTLFFIMLTLGIFLAFAIIGQLITVLWDRGLDTERLQTWKPFSFIFALLSGTYVTIISVVAMGNLAWLRTASGFSTAVHSSLAIHITAVTLTWFTYHSLR